MAQKELLSALLNHELYTQFKSNLPTTAFADDLHDILQTIRAAHEKYQRDLTLKEIEGLHYTARPLLTNAAKVELEATFRDLHSKKAIGADVAADLLSRLWQEEVGKAIGTLGLDMMSGDGAGKLAEIQRIIDTHGDDFLPLTDFSSISMDVDDILAELDRGEQWKFNLNGLQRAVGGVSGGHFLVGGARPNVGKTSLHASFTIAPDGWLYQGAKVLVCLNEEKAERVRNRYFMACTGLESTRLKERRYTSGQMVDARNQWHAVSSGLNFQYINGRSIVDVESMVKKHKPDIVIVDMLDKVQTVGSFAAGHERLKDLYVRARDIAINQDTVLWGFSQLSAEAEGKLNLSQDMLEGSKTGKAAEADLMLLVGKAASFEGGDETQRGVNIAKNKVSGDHSTVHCSLDGQTARYSD